MKTLNDQRLWIANKTKEKKQRIKDHIEQLNDDDYYTMQETWNDYLNLFWNQSYQLNNKSDKVIVDQSWDVYRIRSDPTEDYDTILSTNVMQEIHHVCDVDRFYNITEYFLNS